MPLALTLALNESGSAPIQALWRVLSEEIGADDQLRFGYPPHVTLAIVEDTPDPQARMATACSLVSSQSAFPIEFSSLGVFVGTQASLFAAVSPTERLLACHAEVCKILGCSTVQPHYRPSGWVPHVTLCTVEQVSIGKALAVCTSAWPGRVEASLAAVHSVAFPPVRVLEAVTLV